MVREQKLRFEPAGPAQGTDVDQPPGPGPGPGPELLSRFWGKLRDI